MVDSLLGCAIDISINMSNGVRAAARLRDELATRPVLRPLVYVLKQFLLQRGLNEVFTGGLSSYATAALIISFLQACATSPAPRGRRAHTCIHTRMCLHVCVN
jgi:non-canonical poly(A) RNA polymerase PAPD5/7